jgi:pyrimidine-specific ribonucleoside hydrolase
MIRLLALSTFICFLWSCANPEPQKEKISIIFDTDIGPDYDDVGAITLLHAFADSGHVNILATVASTKYPAVSRVLDVFNTYFERGDLLIGVPKGDAVEDKDFQHWSDTVVGKYPHSIKSNDEVPDAVKLYRKILAAQPDSSVTVVTVGFLTNLAGLLDSSPDEFSDLDGIALVKRKVKKLVSMAGTFPQGREYNIWREVVSAQKVFSSWPGTIVFSGFEIGAKIKTGLPLIANDQITNSPVKDVFTISIPMAEEDRGGRMSWDQTAVFAAVKPASNFFELVPGKIVVNEDGSNTWDASARGHYYLVQKSQITDLTKRIDELMMHQP